MEEQYRMRARGVLAGGFGIQSIGFLLWFIQAIHVDTVSALVYLASTPVAYGVLAWAWWTLTGTLGDRATDVNDLRHALRGFAVASGVLAIGFIALTNATAGSPSGTSTAGAWIEVVGTGVATLGFWLLANRSVAVVEPNAQ